MARMKDRAAKNFRWTAKRPLEDAMYLAYWSYVFGRDDDALQVCEFLSQFQFSGDYKVTITCGLGLKAVLLWGHVCCVSLADNRRPLIVRLAYAPQGLWKHGLTDCS